MFNDEVKMQIAFIITGILIVEFALASIITVFLFNTSEIKSNDNKTVTEEVVEKVKEEDIDNNYKEIYSIINEVNSAEKDFKKLVTRKNASINLKDEGFYYFYKKLEKTQEKMLYSDSCREYFAQYFTSDKQYNPNSKNSSRDKFYFTKPETKLLYYAAVWDCGDMILINNDYLIKNYSEYLSKPYQEFLNNKLKEDEDNTVHGGCVEGVFTDKWAKIWKDYMGKYPKNYFMNDISKLINEYSEHATALENMYKEQEENQNDTTSEYEEYNQSYDDIQREQEN